MSFLGQKYEIYPSGGMVQNRTTDYKNVGAFHAPKAPGCD